jgi:hypothetical protein
VHRDFFYHPVFWPLVASNSKHQRMKPCGQLTIEFESWNFRGGRDRYSLLRVQRMENQGFTASRGSVILYFPTKNMILYDMIYSAFGKSLFTYWSCWKWCPRASTQAWTRLILFANTFCRQAFGKFLCTYKICWKWCSRASVQSWTVLFFRKHFLQTGVRKVSVHL